MESLIREKIGEQAYFNVVPVKRFKTMKITLAAFVPAERGHASEYAVLSDILTRGSRKYPSLKVLEKKLLSLYGAELSSNVRMQGDMQVLSLSLTGLCEKFAFDNTAIAGELSEILCQLLFDPNVSGGKFAENDLCQSKRQVLEAIDSEFNDKRLYSLKRCVEIMCKDSPGGIDRLGDRQGVLNVSAESLYTAWQRLLADARFEIFYISDTGSDAAEKIFKNSFSKIRRTPASLSTELFASGGGVKRVTEEMELSQSKLVMGLSCGVNAESRDYFKMILLSAVLGGTPSSKLFMNIREKQSLCYYCSSRYNRSKGYIVVESGVEGSNLQKAEEGILGEIEQIKQGNISDFEIESAKLALVNSYRSAGDTVSSIEAWYLARITDEIMLTPEQTAKEICDVTKQQLSEIAAGIDLDAVFTLKSKD